MNTFYRKAIPLWAILFIMLIGNFYFYMDIYTGLGKSIMFLGLSSIILNISTKYKKAI
jgi:hypothetical protein